MSSIASLTSAPSALSSMTAHSHGHKKSSRVGSTSNDSEGDAMTPVPAGTQQNLFSSMLQSLEQVIGVQPATAASSAATATSTAALQKYLHNVSTQSNDIRFPTVTGSNVSARA